MPESVNSSSPRILGLNLLTSASMTDIKTFYHGKLGLEVSDERPDRITVHAGLTPITFVKVESAETKPFYHFAFNIPENKILFAHNWQKERTPLLPIPESLRDAEFPSDIVNYSHWNAHSVFFFDPGGNVVEYIARHDLRNSAKGGFSSRDILYASEIAFVVDDVASAVSKLQHAVGIEQYRGASDQFAALGDEHGLLLVMKRGRVISFEATQKKAVTVYRTEARVAGTKQSKYAVPSFPYELSIEKR